MSAGSKDCGQRIKVHDEKQKSVAKWDPLPMGEQLSQRSAMLVGRSSSFPLLRCGPPLEPLCKERRQHPAAQSSCFPKCYFHVTSCFKSEGDGTWIGASAVVTEVIRLPSV